MIDSAIIENVMGDLNVDREIPLLTLIGERHVAENDTWPRIVWVPTSDNFGPSEHAGINPRQLATDFAGYAIHVWDRTVDSTRELMHQVMAAMHRQVSPYSYKPQGAHWVTAGELAANGHLVILEVNFKIPVIDRPKQTARVDTAIEEIAATASGGPQLELTVKK